MGASNPRHTLASRRRLWGLTAEEAGYFGFSEEILKMLQKELGISIQKGARRPLLRLQAVTVYGERELPSGPVQPLPG